MISNTLTVMNNDSLCRLFDVTNKFIRFILSKLTKR